MSKSKPANIVEQLRQAVQASGQTPYALAKLAGIDRAALGRFVHRERGLTLDSAASLCTVLGLELRRVRKEGR